MNCERRSANPAATAELADLLVIEFDRPADAAKLNISDAARAAAIKLAASELGQLNESQAMELGDWYKAHSEKATIIGKAVALSHAKACYDPVSCVTSNGRRPAVACQQ